MQWILVERNSGVGRDSGAALRFGKVCGGTNGPQGSRAWNNAAGFHRSREGRRWQGRKKTGEECETVGSLLETCSCLIPIKNGAVLQIYDDMSRRYMWGTQTCSWKVKLCMWKNDWHQNWGKGIERELQRQQGVLYGQTCGQTWATQWCGIVGGEKCSFLGILKLNADDNQPWVVLPCGK